MKNSLWAFACFSIESCTALVEMDLSYNTMLSTLPEGIGKLKSLKNLNVSNCNLIELRQRFDRQNSVSIWKCKPRGIHQKNAKRAGTDYAVFTPIHCLPARKLALTNPFPYQVHRKTRCGERKHVLTISMCLRQFFFNVNFVSLAVILRLTCVSKSRAEL